MLAFAALAVWAPNAAAAPELPPVSAASAPTQASADDAAAATELCALGRRLSRRREGGRHRRGNAARRVRRRALPPARGRTRSHPARTHAHDLGLPRHRRIAAARGPRPGQAAAVSRPGRNCGGALRCCTGHRRRHLGPGEQVRRARRQHADDRRVGDAGLRRAARSLGARAVARGVEDPAKRRHHAREHDRFVGRRDGADAVPAGQLSRLRSGRRWRRPARHLGQRGRRDGVDGELSGALGLAGRSAMGRRGSAAGRIRRRPGRRRGAATHRAVGHRRRAQRRRCTAAGVCRWCAAAACRRARAGVPGGPELPRHPALQQLHQLRARGGPAGAAPGRRPRRAGGLATRPGRAHAQPGAGAADGLERTRLRRRCGRRQRRASPPATPCGATSAASACRRTDSPRSNCSSACRNPDSASRRRARARHARTLGGAVRLGAPNAPRALNASAAALPRPTPWLPPARPRDR